MVGEEERTCGKGLAANAVLPQKLATLMRAMAELLVNHTHALPRGDIDADQERRAYERLISDQRGVAAMLDDLSAAMRSYRDLPAAPHDSTVLGDEVSREALAAFVVAEEDVPDFLQTQTREYRAMLAEMGA